MIDTFAFRQIRYGIFRQKHVVVEVIVQIFRVQRHTGDLRETEF